MDKELKNKTAKLIIGAGLLIICVLIDLFTSLPNWVDLLIYLVPYIFISNETLAEAFEGIIHGEIFSEDCLMCIATIGALCMAFIPNGEPEFIEAVLVMLLFSVGELFEEIAEGRSKKSISHLLDIMPDYANILCEGKATKVLPSEVKVDDLIIVKAGERIPLDGIVVVGTSSLNTIALTGESLPKDVAVGDTVFSGCININGVITVKVTRAFNDSTVSKIIDLVEKAAEKKSRSEKFITQFAKYYTPIVVITAFLIAFIFPIATGNFSASFSLWLRRALTFLVVSCPCALVISVPLTFFGGIGCASKHGILIKGSDCIDALAHTKTVVFDKTGTLTEGVFEVTAVHPESCDDKHLLHLAAHVERFSTHPIAVSLRQAYSDEDDGCDVSDTNEISGLGITASVNGDTVYVGNSKMMEHFNIKWLECDKIGTIVHVAINNEYAGHIVISDKIKDDSYSAVTQLSKAGIDHTVMLTGDRNEVSKETAQILKINEYHSELLPQDKVAHVETLLKRLKNADKLAFIGDGINDAPVLAIADVGIAMGNVGSDAAIEAADVVLVDDKPSKIADAVKIAKKTLFIAKQNIVFSITIKIFVLVLAAFGLTPMWLAIFADVGVMIIAVLNAMRAFCFRT